MKTPVDVDEALLKEAMAVAGASSKKETIMLALEELIRSRLRKQIRSKIGSGILRTSRSTLRKMRQRRHKTHKAL